MKPLSKYIQYMSLSSCNSIKTFDFSTLYTTIPHSKLTDRLRELVELCFIRNNGQRRCKYFVLGRDSFLGFFEKKTLILPKGSLKLISTCPSFFYWQRICYLWWTCFLTENRAYLWVQTVLIFSPNCSFIRMRETSYRGFPRKTKKSLPDPITSRSAIYMISFH